MRNSTLVRVSVFVLLVSLGGLVGTRVATVRGASFGVCKKADCNTLGIQFSGDCPNQNCNLSGSTGNIIYCVGSMQACNVIFPVVQQSCDGFCNNNPGMGCTSKFNKCNLQ
jgi:hypothetical protein